MQQIKRPPTVVVLVASLACAVAFAEEARKGATFSASAYLSHVQTLASDEYGGRGPGQPGIEMAADYIAGHFKEWGLKPGGDDGTYFQGFEVRGDKQLVDDKAALEFAGVDRKLELHKDWRPFPFTAMDDFDGPLAFAGYGISAEDFGYDDFKDFDATGKVLLIFRYEPKSEDEEADFGGKSPSNHSLFTTKARTAASKGAKALIVVNPPLRDPDKDELYAFEGGGGATYRVPMVQVTREVAAAMLKKAGMPGLEDLQRKLDGERTCQSADMKDLSVTCKIGVERAPINTKNVIGVLEGSGAPDEYIVVGAHYDHMGTSGTGDGKRIYNGADDNASGSSGVLELARAFAQSSEKPRRSIIFMTFSAEERGLLGSKHYVDHPTVPIEQIKAMVNFDMIGRLKQDKLEVWGVQTGREFHDLLVKESDGLGVEFKEPPADNNMFGRSDHASFHRKNIPVLFPFTGLHQQYHKPEDDFDLIDSEGAARLLNMFYGVISDIADMKDGPTFVSAEEMEAAKKAEEAAKPEDAPAAAEGDDARPMRPRVSLGIMPGYGSSTDGLVVDSVVPNRAAQKAGLKDGDTIIQIADTQVKDIYGYMEALRERKPGDEVKVVVMRDGKKLEFKLTLDESPSARGRE